MSFLIDWKILLIMVRRKWFLLYCIKNNIIVQSIIIRCSHEILVFNLYSWLFCFSYTNTEIFPDELRSHYKSSEHQLTPINDVLKQNRFTASCGGSNTQNIMIKYSMARGQWSLCLSQYETHTHTVCVCSTY